MQGICGRDRSVSAGRSHFLTAYPLLYILLGACQGIVGQRREVLTPISLYPKYASMSFMSACPSFVQPIQDAEERLVAWAYFLVLTTIPSRTTSLILQPPFDRYLKQCGRNTSPAGVRPANVCAACNYARQIKSGLPGPGRDRVSLLRLWLSYKIAD